MEKSSSIVLSQEERDTILGRGDLTKSAGTAGNKNVPERFTGWYNHEELKELANEQD